MPTSIWTQSVSEISSALKSDPAKGLDKSEVENRLKEFGMNILPEKGGISWWKIILSQFSSMIVWLLIIASLIAWLLGEAIDAWAILAIVFLNAVLGFFQEFRAERSMEALQKLSSPMSKVIRNGNLLNIFSKLLVPGDLILLESGDKVPADGRIVDSIRMGVDESSLTGESIPVSKNNRVLEEDCPLGDRINMVFRGTAVVNGRGHVLITNTGSATEIGKIAAHLVGKKKEETPLQHHLNQLGKKLVYICLGLVAVIFGLGIFRGNDLIEMLLFALSLAVAAIPEGLPAAVTISLSIGVKKMAEKNALIRRLSSVETLGSTSVICTDKTGTLTENAMTVRAVWVDNTLVEVSGTGYSLEGKFDQQVTDLSFALKIGVLCNNANLFETEKGWEVVGDPTEGALLTLAGKLNLQKSALENEYAFVEEIPFDSERKLMSVLRKKEGKKILFTKGAPDVILAKAKKWLLNGEEVSIDKNKILQMNEELASKAYRVLAVAYQSNIDAPLEEDLVFVGLIAMMDPPRSEVKNAIEKCKKAGIKTVMVTGDHKNTALAIARELDMNEGIAVNGNEIENLSEEEIEKVTIFSRISAEHKLQIIETYKKRGLVTAMTGDGVNDAPAIQAADIGISMGITGTDVAKASSDMIILDDNFASIVNAVEQGRGIYDNIVKFVSYLLSSNIAEILVIFLTMLIGLKGEGGRPFVALLPIQLLWINLVTDGFPAISLAMDPIDPLAMKKPPRPRTKVILNRRFTLFLLSISSLVTIGAILACFYGAKTSVSLAQTMTFTTLIVLELVRVQMIRKQYRMKIFSNYYLIVALASSFLLQLAVIYISPLQIIFGTVPLSLIQWGIILGIAFVLWWIGLGVTKLFYRK